MTTPSPDEVARVAAGLSRLAVATINDGDDTEWYAKSDRAADDIEKAGLVRRLLSHDRKILVPNVFGLLVRAHLMEQKHED